MSVRKDEVQISISFITDESKAFAKTILQTEAFNQKIATARGKISSYEKELKKAGTTEAQRIELLKKLEEQQEIIAANLQNIAEEAKNVAKIDLSKLTPAQLSTRAKQLAQAMRDIPASAPQFKMLEAEQKAVNDQLAQMRARTKGVADAMDDMNNKGGRLSGVFETILGFFGGFSLANAAQMLLDYGRQLFSIGTGLDGLRQKTATVFGEAEVIVRGFAETNANELGLARQEYINLATAAGDLLKPMGFTEEAVAKLSSGLVDQGGILAEWSNGKVNAQEATEILQKALLGERDALNSLGIDIKQAIIDEELKNKGLDKLTGASLRQAEALITLEQVTKQSASANEAFEKNSGSLTRQKAKLRAQLAEVSQQLAGVLLPAFSKVIDVVGPMIQKVVQLGGKLGGLLAQLPGFKLLGPIFSALTTTIGSVLDGLGDLADGIILLLDGKFSDAFTAFKNGTMNIVNATGKGAEAGFRDYFGKNAPAVEASGKKLGEAAGEAFMQGQFDALKKNGEKGKKALEKEAKEAAKAKRDALDAEIKEVELAQGREEIAVELARVKREIGEGAFLEKMFALKKSSYHQQLEIFKKYGLDQQKEALETQKKLIELEATRPQKIAPVEAIGGRALPGSVSSEKAEGQRAEGQKIALVKAGSDAELAILRERFAGQVVMELAQENLLAKNRADAIGRKLSMLAEAGLIETETYRQTLAEKEKADTQYAQTLAENEKRSNDLRRSAQDAALGITRDALSVGIELLGKDEAARKRHAGAIKAFEVGSIVVDSTKEIAGIWRNAQSNPINALIPGWGTAFAVVQTAIAAARAKVAIGKVQAQKFAVGGFTGDGMPYTDETGHRPAGVVHGGEWVAPKWMVDSPKFAPVLHRLEIERLRGFAIGGNVQTTPVAAPSIMPVAAPASMPMFDALVAEVAALRRETSEWQRNLRVNIVHSDIEAVGKTTASIRAEAAF